MTRPSTHKSVGLSKAGSSHAMPGDGETNPAWDVVTEEVASRSDTRTARYSDRPVLSGRFGRYQVLQILGQGAMGAVYLAEDTTLRRKVALKIPQFKGQESSESIERFYREARAAATLQHPGICPVYDVGQINGQHFISMAFIDGHPLSDFTRSGAQVSPRAAANVVRRIAEALAHAHASGVVHRDLKPANVMINQRSEPLVMDFGLALQLDSEIESRMTQDGAILGTPAFMSPEQIKGEQRQIGPSTDIYSLGVILYKLLTGRLPFQGSLTAVIGQIMAQDPPEIADLRPDLDPALQNICARMMAKQQADRYHSMQNVADALADWLQHSQPASEAANAGESTVSWSDEPQQSRGEEQADDEILFGPGHPEVAEMRTTVFHAPPAEVPLEEQPVRRNPPPGTRLFLAFGLAAAVLLGLVLLFRTPDGTLRIEVDDPNLEVHVDGDKIAMIDSQWEGTKKSREHRLALKLRGREIPFDSQRQQFTTGEGRILVKLGDVELQSPQFEVARKGVTVLRISFEPKAKPGAAEPASEQPKQPAMARRPAAVVPQDVLAEREVAEWVLKLGGTISTSEGEIETLSDLPDGKIRITSVNLTEARQLNNADLARLQSLNELEVVSLSRPGTNDAALQYLQGLSSLQTIYLSRSQVTDAGLKHLSGLTGLTWLDLQGTQVTDAGMASLRKLTGLQTLDLEGTSVGDTGLAHLAGLKQLSVLKLDQTQVADAGLEHLKQLTSLSTLALSGTGVGDAGLAHLAHLTELSSLYLRETQVGDEGLSHLEGLTELAVLMLNDSQVSDAGMASLRKLPGLRTLYLAETSVGDKGLSQLAGLGQLSVLILDGTQVGDAGLAHLKQLRLLSTLTLSGTRIGDAGLVHLQELSRLRMLRLSRTQVTREGFVAMQEALPRCRVTWDE